MPEGFCTICGMPNCEREHPKAGEGPKKPNNDDLDCF